MRGTRAALLLIGLALIGAVAGRLAGPFLARANPAVRLAAAVADEERRGVKGETLDTEAFYETPETVSELYARARVRMAQVTAGAVLLGALTGLVLAARLIRLSGRPAQTTYEIDHARCVACTRCFRVCPREQLRRRGGRPAPQRGGG